MKLARAFATIGTIFSLGEGRFHDPVRLQHVLMGVDEVGDGLSRQLQRMKIALSGNTEAADLVLNVSQASVCLKEGPGERRRLVLPHGDTTSGSTPK